MITTLLTIYVTWVIIATLKMSYDVWERTNFTVDFLICVITVLKNSESYSILLQPWKAF